MQFVSDRFFSGLRSHWLGLALLLGIGLAAPRIVGAPDQSMPNVGSEDVYRCPYAHAEGMPSPHRDAGQARIAALVARAEALYRMGDFGDAAIVSREAAGLAADGEAAYDLDNLAAQYRRLRVTWEVGFDPATPAIDALPAVREAWKLDTVLGGAFTDKLQARLAVIAPQAALDFFARDQVAEAEQALETAEALGVDVARTRELGEAIARRHR